MRCHRQFLVNFDQIAEIEWLDSGAAKISPAAAEGCRSVAATCAR